MSWACWDLGGVADDAEPPESIEAANQEQHAGQQGQARITPAPESP